MGGRTIRDIEHGILKRKFPNAARRLRENEIFLAGSFRKPPMIFGCSIAFLAVFLLAEGISFLLRGELLLGILCEMAGAALVPAGYYVLFVIKKEYVYVTNQRIVHVKMSWSQKKEKEEKEILLTQVQSTRLLRDVAWSKDSTSGQISLKIEKRKSSVLLPNLEEATAVYTELNQGLLERKK